MKDNRVILARHNKPVAVILDYKQYEDIDDMLEFAEDYILGSMALKRDKDAKKDDFVNIESW